jgi:glycerol-3-phosphate dehydrogenase
MQLLPTVLYTQTAIDFLARRAPLVFLNAQIALEVLPKMLEIMTQELVGEPRRAMPRYS